MATSNSAQGGERSALVNKGWPTNYGQYFFKELKFAKLQLFE